MQHIHIEELEVFARHGVFEQEQQLGQKFLISAELTADCSRAISSDDIEQTVDYGKICHAIHDFLTNQTFRLIETAADRTAEMLLADFPLLFSVSIEIKKPWAPIGLPMRYVSVRTEKKRHLAVIALGSNMGDKDGYLRFGIDQLAALNGCCIQKQSDFIVTKPYGNVGQDDFLNGVLLLETTMSPYALLDALHTIENLANRKRTIHWGPRTLDLDIIFYDDLIMDTEQLTIPHPDMHSRRFVLEPLVRIAPYLRHPVMNRTVSQLLNDCPR